MLKRFIAIALAAFMLLAILAACAPPPPPAQPDQPPAGATGDAAGAATGDAAGAGTGDAAGAVTGDDALAAVVEGGWKIGIISGTVTQNEEGYLMSRLLEERFGEDRIIRTTWPDNFGAEMEVTIANIQAMADAGARAIVFAEAVPGAIAAIQTTRELFGDDIFFFAGWPHEPPEDISAHADVIVMLDDIGVGRTLVQQAHAMGADTFAHVSFPRHLAIEGIAIRRSLFEQHAAELGMRYVELTTPDPMAEGVPPAQMFVLENVPRWIEEFGQNTAFFTTNCAILEPLMVQVARYGGLVPLQCCPGPFHGFPQAFNLDLHGRELDLDFAFEQLEIAIDEAGAVGRFGTMPVPVYMLVIELGVLYSIEYLEGRTNGRNDPVVLNRLANEIADRFAPGTRVTISNWELGDGRYIDNFHLALQDVMVF